MFLDWDTGTNEGKEAGLYDNKFQEDSPVLLIFPGLTGGSNTKYVRHFALAARQQGARCVVFNYRGFFHPFQTPMATTSCDLSDVDDVVAHVKNKYPNSLIFGSGFSFGANLITKYLGVRGCTQLTGAMCVSNAFDFVKLSQELDKPLNKILYSMPLAVSLKQNVLFKFSGNYLQLQKVVPDIKTVEKVRTIREIDDQLVRHCYGGRFSTVDHYYNESSSIHHVGNIKIPVLFLNSVDDPFAGRIPTEVCPDNENLLFAVTKRGGHVTFAEGINTFSFQGSWMNKVCMQYMASIRRRLGQNVESV